MSFITVEAGEIKAAYLDIDFAEKLALRNNEPFIFLARIEPSEIYAVRGNVTVMVSPSEDGFKLTSEKTGFDFYMANSDSFIQSGYVEHSLHSNIFKAVEKVAE